MKGSLKTGRSKRSIGWYLAHDWQLWVMLLPAVVYIFIFCYIPMYGAQLAFREYSFETGITGGKWVGFKYFEQYFTSSMFGTTLKNTFTISATSILLGFPAPIVLALIINQIRSSKWKRTVQTTVYIPYFISTVVMVSMLNVLFAKKGGVLSDFMKTIGLVSPKANLLGQAKYFVGMYVGSGIWQSMGWNSIIYIAALSSVDTQLYDAAKIDGANRWQRVVHIEFPVLVPTIMILLIMNMGGILNVGFDKVFLMQNTTNIDASEVIATYVYKVGLTAEKGMQLSYSSAVNMFNSVINLITISFVNYLSNRINGSGMW